MIDLAAVSTVLNQLYAPGIADQLNQRSTLLARMPKMLGEGKNIAFDAKVARGTSAGSYASGANITGDDNDTEVPAVLQWKRNKAEFKVAGDALAAASKGGPEAYANLFGKQIADAARNLSVAVSSQMFGDGTGNGGLNIDGLLAAVANAGTYATIDRAVYTIWRAIVLANGGVPRALTTALMRAAERQVFVTSGFAPDLIVTTPAIFEKYEALFDNLKRQIIGGASNDLGLMDLTFKGIPIVRDYQCPAGHMFFLTLDSFVFEQLPPVMAADGISLGDGVEPLMTADGNIGLQVVIEMLGKTGDAYKGFVKLYGNIKCEHPNRNAVIKDVDET